MLYVPSYMSPSFGGGGGGGGGHHHVLDDDRSNSIIGGGAGVGGVGSMIGWQQGTQSSASRLLGRTSLRGAASKRRQKGLAAASASSGHQVRFEPRLSHLPKPHARRQRRRGSAEDEADKDSEDNDVDENDQSPGLTSPRCSATPVRGFHDCHLLGCERVRLNVSGMHFETRLGVLNQHPRTLLGNPQKRARYYDPRHREFFLDRHRPTFEAVFNYYLYGGKLKRPPTVTDDIFLSELEFYEIEREVIDAYKKDEGYISETVVLPEHPVKRRVWMLFEYPETSTPAFFVAIISVLFTVVSIILFCVETLKEFKDSHCVGHELPNFLDPFFIIETACTAWFTFELAVRFSVCPSKQAFIKDMKNAVDFSAIVPYYVTLTNVLITMSCEGAKSSASLAFLRVVRLIRVFKLTKHFDGLQVLVLTFRASIEGLGLFLVALIVCILLFSSTIYYVESEVRGSQIESIPDAFWWAVITMCTVGYGDKVPKGPLGKLVGSVCAVAGVLTLAIPVPIITENFNKFYTHKTGRGRH